MRLKLTGLIIFCLFINLFSSFVLNAHESDVITAVVLDNTMNVAKGFFVSYCISATLNIVMGKITLQNLVTTPEKSKSENKSKTSRDFDQTFFIQTGSNYSWHVLDSKACQNFSHNFAINVNDVQFTILLRKFLQQSFVFLILMALFYLLPRGAIDNYVISNIKYRIV